MFKPLLFWLFCHIPSSNLSCLTKNRKKVLFVIGSDTLSSLSFSFWPSNQQPLYSLLEFAIIFSFCYFFQVWNLFWMHKMNWVYKINLDTFFFLCPGSFKNTEIVCSLKVRQDSAEKLTESAVLFKQFIFGYIPNVCYRHWSIQVLYFFLCQLRSFILY